MENLVQDDRVTEKRCCACKVLRRVSSRPDLSDFYFSRSSGRFDSRCHDCRKAYLREYAAKHRDHIRLTSKQARQRKLAHYRRKNIDWNNRNPDRMREIRQAFYTRHREKMLAKSREYYRKNRERLIAYQKARRQEQKEARGMMVGRAA